MCSCVPQLQRLTSTVAIGLERLALGTQATRSTAGTVRRADVRAPTRTERSPSHHWRAAPRPAERAAFAGDRRKQPVAAFCRRLWWKACESPVAQMPAANPALLRFRTGGQTG